MNNEFEKIETIIKEILHEDARAKVDDMYLYYMYCKEMFLKINYAMHELEFEKVFVDRSYRKSLKIKSFTSVERCRRKLQADYPELCNEKVKTDRINKIKDYIDYAIGFVYKPTLKKLIDKEDQ